MIIQILQNIKEYINKTRKRNCMKKIPFYNVLHYQKVSLVGVEPTVFRLEGGRDIHFATRT